MLGPSVSLYTDRPGAGAGSSGGRQRRYASPLTVAAVAVLLVMLAVLLYALLRPDATEPPAGAMLALAALRVRRADGGA